ncbi:FAD/NAD(P)-binding protein [Kitasatospora sp. NPDC002227]|uniref:FAD/NAD(P)-binding protein n=1 Tax=Kitasatospora sp. NPDC002227 TaxID=3154773 RepID=UPI0033247811
MSSLVIVGGGPLAVGLLARIGASAAGLLRPGQALDIHLVDPYPPGGGRIWRAGLPASLRANSPAGEITAYGTDPGPSLAEWACAQREFAPYREVGDPAVRAELAELGPADHPSRSAVGAYLAWAYRRAVAALPPGVSLTVHRDTARALCGPPDGPQLVELTDRVLAADHVVLALGHLDNAPVAAECPTADFAARHGLFHLLPAATADVDLSGIAPGETLVVRGLGLAFADLLALLTEGRGGRFEETAAGLRYHRSGREPVIHAGSRRGTLLPVLTGHRPAPPTRYLDPAALPAGQLRLRRDIWPLLAKELGHAHYHDLFHAHPERTALPWAEFLRRYDRQGRSSPAPARLLLEAVPDPADRLDLDALDQPLAGRVFDSPELLREHLLTLSGAGGSPGVRAALAAGADQLPLLAGRLTASSAELELDGWWLGLRGRLASGLPAARLRELAALAEAGVLHFLGGGLQIDLDESGGAFLAHSPNLPGRTVRATALIEARLPRHALGRTGSVLLRGLLRTGQLQEETRQDGRHTHRTGLIAVHPGTARLLDPTLDGAPHPRRVAVGPATDTRTPAAFARPGAGSPVLRHLDTVARALLHALAAAEREDWPGQAPLPLRPY